MSPTGGTGNTSLGPPGLRTQDPLQHFPASPHRVSPQASQLGWTGVSVPPVSHATKQRPLRACAHKALRPPPLSSCGGTLLPSATLRGSTFAPSFLSAQ